MTLSENYDGLDSADNFHQDRIDVEFAPGVTFSSVFIKKEEDAVRKKWLHHLTKRKIKTIVRIDEPQYPDQMAEECGFRCVSCEYDKVIPQPGVVSSFLYTLRSSGLGCVVVHSDGRKGRAATLCALYLMHTHGFSAVEATSWLRLVCPSIWIRTAQEHFLHAVGSCMKEGEAGAGGRDSAFRRAVYRVWAKDLRRDYCGSKPQSAYEVIEPCHASAFGVVGSRPDSPFVVVSEDRQVMGQKCGLEVSRCGSLCLDLLRLSELPRVWATDFRAGWPGETTSQIWALPLQLLIK